MKHLTESLLHTGKAAFQMVSMRILPDPFDQGPPSFKGIKYKIGPPCIQGQHHSFIPVNIHGTACQSELRNHTFIFPAPRLAQA